MQADLRWLTDPTVFQVNRLPAHSDHSFYADFAEMEKGISSFVQSLNGTWDFSFAKTPAERPADFYLEDFDDSAFGKIEVPGHIETQGYGKNHYINTLYPWDGHKELRPPMIDFENTTVGSYVCRFDLAEGLLGKPVAISFQGAEQAIYVWLNGHFVGYAEDSFTPSDFDLTPYIREKNNRLCVEAYQHSSAGWLEDQDFFRFSGLFRPVFLYAKPQAHIEDMWIKAGLMEDNTTGTFALRLKLSGKAAVFAKVSDKSGKVLLEEELQFTEEKGYLHTEKKCLENITKWDNKNPALYDLLLVLKDETGEIIEAVPYRFGFRRFEMINRIMHLNGERIVFNGVNRHEWNAHKGRALGDEDMYAAMAMFKENNINAVRTCHYPDQSLWYRLCDENGIYMIDEANLESHGTWQKPTGLDPSWNVPGSLPEWKEAVIDRARSMFERDKNHTAILIWSCGNESYAGADILAMTEFFHENDPGRLVHYESSVYNREFDACSDVESRMYFPPEKIREYLENDPKKPFILCEYMHSMGNSVGGMESYIRLAEEYPMYQGGFIWDYMDQALWHKNPQGEMILGYGGDFEDRPTDYDFCANGIVFADGKAKPAMQEVRYWYADAETRAKHDEANKKAAEAVLPIAEKEAKPLVISHGDGYVGVRGNDFEVLFAYFKGGPVSIVSRGREWLGSIPKPAFWRAPTSNDKGNNFCVKSGIWSAVDSWQQAVHKIEIENEKEFKISYLYTSPAMPGLETTVSYHISGSKMDVSLAYKGEKGRPELPIFGLRFATPKPLCRVDWTGLSGETYPDRKKGGIFGQHSEVPAASDYIVPQDHGCHADTYNMKLASNGAELQFEKLEKPFLFSAVPHSPAQLSEAQHQSELPAIYRTIVTISGEMRGVGGIDSWGSVPEAPYHVSAEEDYSFSFRVHL